MQLNIPQFKKGVIISLVLAALLFAFSLAFGKNNFFLMLNGNWGVAADYFFMVFTNGGDGTIWIAALAAMFLLKKPKAWPLLAGGFVISTLLTQIPKNFIFPAEPRPWTAIANHRLIHHVPFVQPLGLSSFPSGHTMTAFCIYLSFCLLINKSWWLYLGLAYAMLVGYSRVYLAQHFPLDVAAGITGGIISTWLSLLIQKAVYKHAIAYQ